MGYDTRSKIGDSRIAARLRRAIEGEVLFDAFDRGRYSTDASIYQIEPVGVVIPKTEADVAAAIAIAVDEGIPVLPRGGGTSQCGQTVGAALVIDTTKHLNRIVAVDAAARRVTVEPGIVLDHLNAALKPHGLMFPVDVSTAAQATIGGMTGNNSCGSRSIRYGNMVHNVAGIEALLADGNRMRFGEIDARARPNAASPHGALIDSVLAIAAAEAGEVEARFPKLLRRVGGYNLDEALGERPNLARLLVGSEGTLAFSTRIELMLAPIPPARVLGVVHFERFYDAMATTRHIVGLGPTAVELVDRTMIDLSRAIPAYRPIVDRFVRGRPEAILLVEFAGDDAAPLRARLDELEQVVADHGFPGAVLKASEADFQRDIWEVRKAGLNIMMSMKGDAKPVSFIEDCAVRLEDLADYTDRLTRLFTKYGTTGTWYAHASVGCLHVRPVLNMKNPDDVGKMRAIAEEAFAIVREYKGSHSGEHGDGLVRSEFHAAMFGPRLVGAFEKVKAAFDPKGLMNPGKIVQPSKMDDRSLFRFKPGYAATPMTTALDWSEAGGLNAAVEMCNNNGACRKATDVMCPSFRVTQDERDVTRGRANSLRLALSGQLGLEALASDDMAATMALCVGCKGCKRECPTGVDMARMKIEVLHQRRQRHGLTLRDRLVAYVPRYAPIASRLAGLFNLRDKVPGLAWLSEAIFGLSARRSLPRWRTDPFRAKSANGTKPAGAVLFVDTFTRYFEPENAEAALDVLSAGGITVAVASPGSGRPLCCGRTYLAVGMIDEAKAEARRTLAALRPHVAAGRKIVGLEPSCLFTLKDEFKGLVPGDEARALAASVQTFEEFLIAERAAGRLALRLKPVTDRDVLVHGHCHQKAFGAAGAVEQVLRLVPGLGVKAIQSSCCGMAGAFGLEDEHYDVSMAMGERALLPAVRAAAPAAMIVADGTSCRHQILDGTGRTAVHAAVVLRDALDRTPPPV